MDSLTAGARLTLNACLQSNNGEHTLVMQPDGNLVLYEGWPSSPAPVWASNTEWLPIPQRPTYLEMQADGNLVLYNDSQQPAWATGTDGHAGARVVMQDDRNLVIYDSNDKPLWASNTNIDPQSVVRQYHKVDTVGYAKTMTTDVTLYANGLLMVDTFSQNKDWSSGLRPRVLVVVRDGKGRAIFMTDPIAFSTLCSVPDLTCASNRREQHTEQWPDVIAQYAGQLDVYQGDAANYVDLHNQLVTAAKTINDVADALKDAIAMLKLL
jgi:hypothetical protein